MLTTVDVQQKQDHLGRIVKTLRESVHSYVHRTFREELKAERASLDTIKPADPVALAHVLWMCAEIDEFIRDQRFDKANRWIGFVQAIFWIVGVASIDESRAVNEWGMNKPCATCGKPGHRPMDHAGWDPTKEGHG